MPVKLCRTAGSMHLFKIIGNLSLENVKLRKFLPWDILKLEWKEVNRTLNNTQIKVQNSCYYMIEA